MSATALTDLLLTGMSTYGAWILAGALLLGALGLPVPGTLMVIAAGALVKQGTLDWYVALPAALLGAVTGDNTAYLCGRRVGGWVQRRFDRSPAWAAAGRQFNRHGSQTIYLTRFLFTPLALPTNLIAGSQGFSFARFAVVGAAGEFTWLGLYGGLGYAVGSQWQTLAQSINTYSGYLAAIAILGMGLVWLVRNRPGPQWLPTTIRPAGLG